MREERRVGERKEGWEGAGGVGGTEVGKLEAAREFRIFLENQ